jgi:cell division septation protein DedD
VIELERHIEILLLSNDCVILPDFGGFVAHHVEAYYSEVDGMFIPPTRTVGFNQQLKLNDSLLAQSYIEAYDISYREAMLRIEDEINQLKAQLVNDGHYTINNIGTLSVNEEGNYDFKPYEAGILTPSLYGLSSFTFFPINLSIRKDNVEQKRYANTVAVPDESQEPLDEKDNKEDNGKFIKIPLSILRNIAAACIAVIVFFLLPKPLANDKQMVNEGGIETNLLYTIMPKDVTTHKPNFKAVKKTEVNVKKQHIQKAETNAKQPDKEKSEEIIDKDFFTIVLASKVSRHNAQDFVSRLHKDGYKEAEIRLKPHNNKVIYGHYSTMREANKIKNKLNDNVEFADSWITEIKQK